MEIADADSPKTCSSLCVVKDKALPKSTLSQHFKVLREAGLVRSERKGVEMRNTARCRDLKNRFGLSQKKGAGHSVQKVYQNFWDRISGSKAYSRHLRRTG